ncbi:MAG: tyrosine-type recombinase/integrase [Patescibacteria group bacterium]|nr:tyrosine-type recombinase/integrase [Patescibacteria group bacterium]
MIDITTCFQTFREHLMSRKRAQATIVAYTKDIEQFSIFLSHIGKKYIDQVTETEIYAFIKKLENDNYTQKSISRKINSIKTFFRHLKLQGYVRYDPSQDIQHPKYEIKPPRILSKLEYRALRDACKNDIRTYAIVELLLQTGIRIGEIPLLTLQDVKNDTLHIPPQEGHEEREVPLNKKAQQALNKYLEIRGGPKEKTSPLFITKSGKPLLVRNIRTSIDRYFKAAGVEDAKVNDLRHTFIAHHLMAGTPITTVSRLVGHKRLTTTEKYLNFIKSQKEIPQQSIKLEEL